MKYVLLLCSVMLCDFAFANTIIHQENFNTCGSSTWIPVSGTADTDAADAWSCTPTSGTQAYIGIMDDDGNNDEDWLVSPALDLDAYAEEYFSFRYENSLAIKGLTLWYSNDYSGANTAAAISAATWTAIALDVYDVHNDSYTPNESYHRSLDLSGIAGTSVYLAFRFNSTSAGEGWALDDFKITADYYTSVEAAIAGGSKCEALKTELHNLIKTQTRIPYTSSGFDMWEAFYVTDRRLNDTDTDTILYDMYSDNPVGVEPYEFSMGLDQDPGSGPFLEGANYNREHVFPKSWWGGSTAAIDTQYTDIHHIVPSDKVVNNRKSNFPMGETNVPDFTSMNGCKRGPSSLPGYSGTIFEPIDDYKGDYARMLLYMTTRYQYLFPVWETNSPDVLTADTYTSFEPWLLENLICWHENDPVSQKEIDRNNAVFSIQGNRNPFIDRPDYVFYIWGTCGDVGCPAVLPVELITFEGKALPDGNHQLTWATASEWMSDYFEVEHSQDGHRFESLARLAAAGYSEQPRSYEYLHREAPAGYNYYRLKAVDTDGTYTYSPTIAVFKRAGHGIRLYPTVTDDVIKVETPNLEADLELYIHDTQGNLVSACTLRKNTIETVQLGHLPTGMYFVRFEHAGMQEVERVFVR